MTEIPKIKGRGRKSIYHFNTVTKETPLSITFKDIAHKRSIVASALKYADLHDIKFVTRTTGENVVTIYLKESNK